MMIKKARNLLILFFLIASIKQYAFESQIDLDSRPTSVTVYPDRALVTRTAKAKLPAGIQTVKLIKLPFGLIKESVRVNIESASKVKILSSDLMTDFKSAITPEDSKGLQRQLDELKKKKEALNDKVKNLAAEKKMLGEIEVKTVIDKNKEISISKFNPDDWDKLLGFYSANLNRIDNQARELNEQDQIIQAKINSIQNQMGASRDVKTGENYLVVTLESDKEADTSIKVSYFIPQASWLPMYEIHSDDGKNIDLHYMAKIKQNTGEDWNNVNLTLSTARPAMGINVPEVKPLTIFKKRREYYKSSRNAGSRPQAKSSLMEEKESASGQQEEDSDLQNPEQPVLEQANYEESVIEKTFISTVFQIRKKSSITSDNSYHEIMITNEKLNAMLNYNAAPFLNETVFMEAKIKNNLTYPFLSGPANLFIDNNFIGSTTLKEVVPQESFSLPLGPDEGIKIKYTKMKESNDTYGLGKKRKKTIYEYKIEIENLKNNALDLTLKDRIPVSSDTDIKVEITDMDPKNDNNIAGDQGIILWKLFLKSREKKVIHFTYYLDRPEDLNFYFQ